MDSDSTKTYSPRAYTTPDRSYTPDSSVSNDWHVSRNAYEAHCGQVIGLEAELEARAKVSSAMSAISHDRGTMLL